MTTYTLECELQEVMVKRAERQTASITDESDVLQTTRVNGGCLECIEKYPGKGDPECPHYQKHYLSPSRINGNGKKKDSHHQAPKELGDVVEGNVPTSRIQQRGA